jgi:SAM-dependent methyltransferase
MLQVLRERGLRFFWDYFRESIWFDIRHRTSTSIRVIKNQQSIDSNAIERENGILYVASFTSVTKKTLQIVKEMLGEKRMRAAQFFDLGCGKGKALIVYARNFNKNDHALVGIEYDPYLAEQARRNVRKVSFSRGRVQIFTDSATKLRKYLTSNIAVIYLYNPFVGQTFISTLSVLKDIPHFLIYVDPVERERLADFGYVLVAEHIGRYNADTWLVARSADMTEINDEFFSPHFEQRPTA